MGFCLKSWVYGLKQSLAGLPLPFAVDLADYNGTILPRLPYWDMSKFTNAYIHRTSTGYNLSATDTQMYLDGDKITSGGEVNTLLWNCTDGITWVQDGGEHHYSEYYWTEGIHVWSNVAIGTKYPGTLPIPIYGGES